MWVLMVRPAEVAPLSTGRVSLFIHLFIYSYFHLFTDLINSLISPSLYRTRHSHLPCALLVQSIYPFIQSLSIFLTVFIFSFEALKSISSLFIGSFLGQWVFFILIIVCFVLIYYFFLFITWRFWKRFYSVLTEPFWTRLSFRESSADAGFN